MSYLTINGITVPCASVESRFENQGLYTRAYSGRPVRQVRSSLREWDFETTIVASSLVEPLISLIHGQGHTFDGSEIYASTGLGFSNHANVSAGNTNVPVKFGDWAETTGPSVSVSAEFPSTTAMWWQQEAGYVWVHHACTRTESINGIDGTLTKYTSGSVTSATLSITITPTQVVTLENACRFDDLVILKGIMPASWIATWASATTGFSPMPNLYTGGDFGVYTVLGEVTGIIPQSAYISGSWQTGASIRFTLREVR
jgi:hypothetical protein